jgi:ribose 5-phosphate isomerase A
MHKKFLLIKKGPVVTDNGNFIIDWKFDTKSKIDWNSINTELLLMPGVIETGLFLDMAYKAYFGDENGDVSVISK